MTDIEKKYFTQLTEVIETIQKALFKIDERLKELERKQNDWNSDKNQIY